MVMKKGDVDDGDKEDDGDDGDEEDDGDEGDEEDDGLFNPSLPRQPCKS